MFNENEIRLTGNVTAIPNLQSIEGGKSVAKAILIHNRSFTVAGEEKPRVQRVAIAIELWDNDKGRAAKFAKMVNSKTPIHVKGTLKMEEWNDNNTGAPRSQLKINVSRWDFLLPKDYQAKTTEPDKAKSGGRGNKSAAAAAKG